MKIGYGITASYCTLEKSINNLKELVQQGHDVYPIISENLIKFDTRFGKSSDIIKQIEEITKKKVCKDIVEAEQFGPKNKMDIMVIMPASGDFIAKLSHGITDNAVNLAVKATLRNQRPIVIGIATNDGLGMNGKNIMELLNTKNIFFVPFGQDDVINKPNSLISCNKLLIDTINEAINGKQLQPLLLSYNKLKEISDTVEENNKK